MIKPDPARQPRTACGAGAAIALLALASLAAGLLPLAGCPSSDPNGVDPNDLLDPNDGAYVFTLVRVADGFVSPIALAAPDTHQQAIAAGLTSLVVLQAAVNAGAVMGMVPITGVPLPFVSFGGSSLIVLLASAGILVNIGRNSRRSSLRALRGGAEGGDRRERDGRARHPGAGRRRGAGSARG